MSTTDDQRSTLWAYTLEHRGADFLHQHAVDEFAEPLTRRGFVGEHVGLGGGPRRRSEQDALGRNAAELLE